MSEKGSLGNTGSTSDAADENSPQTLIAAMQSLEARLGKLESTLLSRQRDASLQLYRQFEAFHWLTKRLAIKSRLPPLRGWPLSPDVLLELHEAIMTERPRRVLEFGSGVSTLIIADALSQIGEGRLVSLEHSPHYAEETRRSLEREGLLEWVDLRIGELAPWQDEHLVFQATESNVNDTQHDQTPHWYPVGLLDDLEAIDFVLVDGPPARTNRYARYPALPAVVDRLAPGASVWLDDASRWEEKKIVEAWSERYAVPVERRPMEKGLAILTFSETS